MGATQFALLFALGLRENHTLCDVGCGSLRAGRLLIPYLAPGNYCGIEPRTEVLEDGLRYEIGDDVVAMRRPRFNDAEDMGTARFGMPFDFVLAQSIFSHTYLDLARTGLRGIEGGLGPNGLLVATFYERFPVVLPAGNAHRPEGGSGWRYPGAIAFTWREWKQLLQQEGFAAKRIRWAHLRQTWFVAARIGNEARIHEAVNGMKDRLEGPGAVGHARRRALARLRRS
jgi:SAM-dependent methyltransferase